MKLLRSKRVAAEGFTICNLCERRIPEGEKYVMEHRKKGLFLICDDCDRFIVYNDLRFVTPSVTPEIFESEVNEACEYAGIDIKLPMHKKVRMHSERKRMMKLIEVRKNVFEIQEGKNCYGEIIVSPMSAEINVFLRDEGVPLHILEKILRIEKVKELLKKDKRNNYPLASYLISQNIFYDYLVGIKEAWNEEFILLKNENTIMKRLNATLSNNLSEYNVEHRTPDFNPINTRDGFKVRGYYLSGVGVIILSKDENRKLFITTNKEEYIKRVRDFRKESDEILRERESENNNRKMFVVDLGYSEEEEKRKQSLREEFVDDILALLDSYKYSN